MEDIFSFLSWLVRERQWEEKNGRKDRKEIERKDKWSQSWGDRWGEREWVKRWTTEFLGRRKPNWERKCFRGEHEGVLFRWHDLEVSLQTEVCPVSKESPIIQGAPMFPELVWFLPHVPRDTSRMPDPLRFIGPGDQGTVYTALPTPHHCHHPFQLRPLWSLREASNQSSRLGLASRSESMASWHHWEQWLTFLPVPGGVIS